MVLKLFLRPLFAEKIFCLISIPLSCSLIDTYTHKWELIKAKQIIFNFPVVHVRVTNFDFVARTRGEYGELRCALRTAPLSREGADRGVRTIVGTAGSVAVGRGLGTLRQRGPCQADSQHAHRRRRAHQETVAENR